MSLYKLVDGNWQLINKAITNSDGRCADLLLRTAFQSGRYKLHFNVEEYFQSIQTTSIYPFIEVAFQDITNVNLCFWVFNFCVSIFQITFDCLDQNSHYHIPLLLNPYGYTTYRGSWIHYCAYFESPSPSEIKSSSTTDNFNFMYQIKRLRNELEWTIQRAFSMLFTLYPWD